MVNWEADSGQQLGPLLTFGALSFTMILKSHLLGLPRFHHENQPGSRVLCYSVLFLLLCHRLYQALRHVRPCELVWRRQALHRSSLGWWKRIGAWIANLRGLLGKPKAHSLERFHRHAVVCRHPFPCFQWRGCFESPREKQTLARRREIGEIGEIGDFKLFQIKPSWATVNTHG